MTIERDSEIMVKTYSPERAREFLGVVPNTPVREVRKDGDLTVYAIPADAQTLQKGVNNEIT